MTVDSPCGWDLVDNLLRGGSPCNGVGHELNAQFVQFLREAERILIFTGPGVSRASSLPEMGEPQRAPPTPVTHQEFISSADARMAYWEWKDRQWNQFRRARPNAIHWAIVELERAQKLELLATHGVDGLQLWAGTSPSRVVELHGSNAELECLVCGQRQDPGLHYQRFRRQGVVPTCDCGGFLKATALSLDQTPRLEDLERAATAAAAADLVVSVGSTLDTYPASSIPLLAAHNSVPYVVVSDEPTHHDDHPQVSLCLHGDLLSIFAPTVAAACHPRRM